MPTLNIKDPEVHRLAALLAARRHTSMTRAVRQALEEAVKRMESDRTGMSERLLAIGRRARAEADAAGVAILTDDDLYDLEASVVVTEALHSRLDELVRDMDADLVPFDAEQAQLARRAYADYGRGSSSPARLNFGDCFSYALAQMTGRPPALQG